MMYAITNRDVIYQLSRTQNIMRNVIVISIGFDIVANRILEVVDRYASRYDPRYQKVYWITGEAGGGSVANLLTKKMIKNQIMYIEILGN